MWIKALDRYVWVNIKHITHFEIEEKNLGLGDGSPPYYVAYAYLNASSMRWSPSAERNYEQDQARISVCQGSKEECGEFIDKTQFLEGLFQWVGYLVAGGIGAILTLIFQSIRP